ncbi:MULTISPECIES: carboxymuconolactone decarboxylase family protein [unclassified Amycolatopsis]|uniref:carboxymuconolactone decarboxylase family protein n=1 Tax=unclassified Amycolatopsis TaxID=2618356 RepID=UPI0028750C05|nr:MULTISPECIES: carboxymuconolactone decarboxylase family protein [unclassified Amycolatopsis]MDS0132158.1 carboxymuconolactone decarboxylase family protein [Amycolatopsis sp. 505]MDS0141104.1 carboxymuconolactone decarboxylase family protein [Amycolatopsis sp. CM201R]
MSRLPDPAQFFPEMGDLAGALTRITMNGSIPRSTIHLVQLRIGQLVGSTYHTIRQAELLRKTGASEEQVTSVASWPTSPYFSEEERVALELAEAVFTASSVTERVPDELFARASACYDDKALWTLTLVLSQMSYFVPVALIAKPIPGLPLGKNYR